MPVVDAEAQLVAWVAAELPCPCQPGHGVRSETGQVRALARSRLVRYEAGVAVGNVSVHPRDAGRRGRQHDRVRRRGWTRACISGVLGPVTALALDPERPPSPRSTMERCAPEVWVEILRHIGGSQAARARSLKATSLAFKALTPYAQAELFRSVNIETVSDAKRLLEAYTSNHALKPCIREVKLHLASYSREKLPLYKWLVLEPGTGVLASFTRVTFLDLWSTTRSRLDIDVQTTVRIFSHFKTVRYLQLGLEHPNFKQVATLFSCLGSTLRHLVIVLGLTDMDYAGWETSGIPSVLSAETLSHYTPQDALPHLESLQFREGIGPELTEWFFRSGVINRIRSLKVNPELFQDVEYTALLLSRGCRRLECLVLDMASIGWEGLDESIGMFSSDPS
jgi:hypothetical protein